MVSVAQVTTAAPIDAENPKLTVVTHVFDKFLRVAVSNAGHKFLQGFSSFFSPFHLLAFVHLDSRSVKLVPQPFRIGTKEHVVNALHLAILIKRDEEGALLGC